jgi:hypothetical protein
MLQDEFSVTANMQEIEGVINGVNATLAIGRGLVWAKLGKPVSSTPQSSPWR